MGSFSIQIKWIKKVFAFDFGYIHADIESITNWNVLLGPPGNRYDRITHSNSFFVGWRSRHFYYSQDGSSEKSKYVSTNHFCEGDTFTLQFDFNKKEISLFHNGQRADVRPLKYKKVIPAISMRLSEGHYNCKPNGDILQIINAEY